VPDLLVNWASRSLSFFNTIALLWLGLSVLLNAEQRRWGTVLAGTGLVLGGIFFAAHTTIVGRPFGTFPAEMDLWWRLGWIPFVSPPYIWYVVVAWYANVLGMPLHRVAVSVLGVLGVLGLALIFFVSPLPSYSDLLHPQPTLYVQLGRVPTIVLLYPAYSAMCILLSIAALRHPAASGRFMGELARQRARPWLLAASLVLLAVSVLVGAMAWWVVRSVQAGELVLQAAPTATLLKLFDAGISGLLAVVIVLIGRAVASYEVFTGKALPRGGLLRQWRNGLILAGSFGVLMGGSLDVPVDPIFRLVLATVAMAVLYALHSWRVYVDREERISQLRPFVASDRLYDRLLSAPRSGIAESPADGATEPFHALCRDVLGAELAYLVPRGPLAPFAGASLVYPAGRPTSDMAANIDALLARIDSPQTMCVPLEPSTFDDAVWGVPLWSERGLVGILLLGPKADGQLYTQEEIEIARATGERLVDIQASAEMARRLVELQRQRLAESQIVDARARRALHDEILPRLHAALLALASGPVPASRPAGGRADSDPLADAAAEISAAHREIANLLRAMPTTVVPRIEHAGLFGALRQAIDGEMAGTFESVTWNVASEAERAARGMEPLTLEVLFGAAREAARNAARHGRGGDAARPLRLTVGAEVVDDAFEMLIEDTGVGLATPAAAPPSTEQSAPGMLNSGQGLGLHSTLMAVVGGTMAVDAASHGGTRVRLSLPI
jgi:anti-sigma regulatory factor (Ser/Thr protein kinase)